ncbi:hypothetical protein Tco_1474058 [Tanacetum coccineum]
MATTGSSNDPRHVLDLMFTVNNDLMHDVQSVTSKWGILRLSSYNMLNRLTNRCFDIAWKNMFKEVFDVSERGNPLSLRPYDRSSLSIFHLLRRKEEVNFLMEEIDEFLEHDDSIPPGVEGVYDSEGDIAYLEELLSVINNDLNLPPSPVCEINVPEKVKSSCEDPPDLELKDLPSYLDSGFKPNSLVVPKKEHNVDAKMRFAPGGFCCSKNIDVVIRDKKRSRNSRGVTFLGTLKIPIKANSRKKKIRYNISSRYTWDGYFREKRKFFKDVNTTLGRPLSIQDLGDPIARIVKTLVLSILSFIHKSFTSSASFWESSIQI